MLSMASISDTIAFTRRERNQSNFRRSSKVHHLHDVLIEGLPLEGESCGLGIAKVRHLHDVLRLKGCH